MCVCVDCYMHHAHNEERERESMCCVHVHIQERASVCVCCWHVHMRVSQCVHNVYVHMHTLKRINCAHVACMHTFKLVFMCTHYPRRVSVGVWVCVCVLV